MDHIELLDYIAKKKRRYCYRNVLRDLRMEEEELEKMGWCEVFKCKISPRDCMLRQKYDRYGYCSRCEGVKKLHYET